MTPELQKLCLLCLFLSVGPSVYVVCMCVNMSMGLCVCVISHAFNMVYFLLFQDIVGKLVEQSDTFKTKTEFSQEKYIKKKKKK